ncbi:MAG: C1 family peptidase [Erysipelotrichaceae bacterium]|nr:C1 family peptidase [Erysipelotrichaceae bacterium]
MKNITMENLQDFRKKTDDCENARTLQCALAQSDYNEASFIPSRAIRLNEAFSLEIRTRGVTDQHNSGRCWLFSAMNIIRERAMDTMGLESLELSGNYLAFYDKLEKCNNFLQTVINNADKPLNDRMNEYILGGIEDNGYFDMARDLIYKYGVVPYSVMPETYQSNNTARFIMLQNSLLRKDASLLRQAVAEGKDAEKMKLEMLEEMYRAQCIAFGQPPERFDYSWRDTDGNYHAEHDITPRQFYEKYINIDLNEYMTVTNHPTDGQKMNGYYRFHYKGNMADKDCRVLNVTMDELERMILAQLKDKEPVCFGCDWTMFYDQKTGIWDHDSFDYKGFMGGADSTMSKKERLMYHDGFSTHAMVLTGVNFDKDGKPDRWKIENSFGSEAGQNGYFACSQKFFREYVYEAIINVKYLNEEQKRLLETEPVELNPWESNTL